MIKIENEFSLMGDRLKALRKKRKYTQGQICCEIGCTAPTYRDWEHGKRSPDMVYVIALAKLYGVSCDYILGLTDFTNIGNKEIHQKTGLSNKAIDCLADLKNQEPIIHNQKYVAKVISRILEGGFNGISLLVAIAEYLELCKGDNYSLTINHENCVSTVIKDYDISSIRIVAIQQLLYELKMDNHIVYSEPIKGGDD